MVALVPSLLICTKTESEPLLFGALSHAGQFSTAALARKEAQPGQAEFERIMAR